MSGKRVSTDIKVGIPKEATWNYWWGEAMWTARDILEATIDKLQRRTY